ncbi:hypothetical protein [Streptomyces blastmyceticus]|uniref:Uncharacterized protein n=1 Tax=Streptomyces blastmyceticus TaxID=68180 RepID=A0ABN0WTB6_9ACTN
MKDIARRSLVSLAIAVTGMGAILASAGTAAADEAASGPTLLSMQNFQQGITGPILSPGSVSDRRFLNTDRPALVDLNNTRQGVVFFPIANPGSVNTDKFINRP